MLFEPRHVRLWVDDLRPAPDGYEWVKTTRDAMNCILLRGTRTVIDVLDLDHDAGDYAEDGGDYIKILDFMEEHGINDIPIHLHTMNPVGRENMRRIIRHNGWKEI